MDQARKFLTLDALRGVAALTVVLFHMPNFTGTQRVPHGYLAVDFFFMLSGFVLSFAYQQKLDQGWSTAAFMKARFIRLYPLYLLGFLLGFCLRLLDHAFGKPSLPASTLLVLLGTGLALMPVPLQFADVSPFAYPLNIPSWSLFFEVFANLIHAWFFRARAILLIASALALSAAAFLLRSLHDRHTDFGSRRTDLLGGVPRVLFSYLFGMLLLQLWRRRALRFAIPSWLSAVLLILLLIGPTGPSHSLAYDLCAVFLCFPVLLLLSAASQPSTRFAQLFQSLGLASYAVYVLHIPLAAAFFAILSRVLSRARFQALASWESAGFVALIIAIALLVDRYYDEPVRRGLRQRLGA